MRRSASEVIRNLEMRVARLERQSSSRLAQESIKRGDLVMILSFPAGMPGTYYQPAQVTGVYEDGRIRFSTGMAELIRSPEEVVKATGRRDEDIRIWKANH